MKRRKQEKTKTAQSSAQELEQTIETCRKYFSKETIEGIMPAAKLALYSLGVEMIPEASRGPMYGVLAAEYAKAADEATNNNRPTEAGIYRMIAIQYLQKTGIDIPKYARALGAPDAKANIGANLGDYLKAFYGEGTPSKAYSDDKPGKKIK